MAACGGGDVGWEYGVTHQPPPPYTTNTLAIYHRLLFLRHYTNSLTLLLARIIMGIREVDDNTTNGL